MTRKIAFKTLGCRLNQYETDALVSQFHKSGYKIVDYNEEADIYVVNTCTVTNQGDAKSRKAIYRATKKHDDPVVIVTGCMVDGQKEQLQKLNGITYFVENAQKSSIFNIADAHFKGETVNPEEYNKDLFGFEPADTTFHTRSYIKIQDGCDNFCTFCIVPKVRGRAVSRPIRDILENIRQVVDFGFKEVVLTGVNLGRYTYDGIDFEHLVEQVLEVPGDFRVRISSIEPEGFGDRLFSLFGHPKLMPHLHLCLQSGSDKILLKMRRFYNIKTFMSMVDRIRGRYPDFNLTTDIIVGFPGEMEEDFEQSCKIVREAGFSHIHTFKYSKRDGTRAARMEKQVPGKVKNERSRAIRDISAENKKQYRGSLIGKEQQVLIEKYNASTQMAKGYGNLYIPIEFKTGAGLQNNFSKVLLTGLGPGDDPVLQGKMEEWNIGKME